MIQDHMTASVIQCVSERRIRQLDNSVAYFKSQQLLYYVKFCILKNWLPYISFIVQMDVLAFLLSILKDDTSSFESISVFERRIRQLNNSVAYFKAK